MLIPYGVLLLIVSLFVGGYGFPAVAIAIYSAYLRCLRQGYHRIMGCSAYGKNAVGSYYSP
ncbi:hypothetical protein HMPREF0673_02805 [Leyella stercorea DSM 18206]|uniref:Uncharacterized protein n=1 Tax=Leyella stercorea DSM 18206 TaxID=1002367 RepID=G6B1M9_9BACT|nr:hypothetical protein HMPREF0673_02805 [Leyella stercorea DSM 18206]